MLNGFAIMDFDTKIAIAVRDDLAVWQKLNVTAFITSGIIGQHEALLGDEYEDASAIKYAPLLIQPVIVLTCDDIKMKTIHRRGLERGVKFCLYIEDMFQTGHDNANRATVKKRKSEMIQKLRRSFAFLVLRPGLCIHRGGSQLRSTFETGIPI